MMKSLKYVLIVGLAVGALAGCTEESVKPSPADPPAPVVGGYSQIADPETDEGLFHVTKFLSYEIGDKEGDAKNIWVDKVLEAYKQVVAGANYRVKVQMNNGSRYEAVVYVDLKDEISLTSLEKLASAKPPPSVQPKMSGRSYEMEDAFELKEGNKCPSGRYLRHGSNGKNYCIKCPEYVHCD